MRKKLKTRPNQTIILSHFQCLLAQFHRITGCTFITNQKQSSQNFPSEASEEKGKNSRKAPKMSIVLWLKHLAVTSHSAGYCKGTECVQLTLENEPHHSEGRAIALAISFTRLSRELRSMWVSLRNIDPRNSCSIHQGHRQAGNVGEPTSTGLPLEGWLGRTSYLDFITTLETAEASGFHVQ